MTRDILHKKHYDIADELYKISSRLVVKAEEVSSGTIGRSVIAMKAYVQWSKNNLEPLEDAIEKLVQRVRDDTKAGERVFTRAERAELHAKYEEWRRQSNKELAEL